MFLKNSLLLSWHSRYDGCKNIACYYSISGAADDDNMAWHGSMAPLYTRDAVATVRCHNRNHLKRGANALMCVIWC